MPELSAMTRFDVKAWALTMRMGAPPLDVKSRKKPTILAANEGGQTQRMTMPTSVGICGQRVFRRLSLTNCATSQVARHPVLELSHAKIIMVTS